jgi:hypothetical protein
VLRCRNTLQSRENLKVYNGTIDAIVKVVRSEGVSAVYKGFEPMVLRNFTWNGCFFGVAFYLVPRARFVTVLP